MSADREREIDRAPQHPTLDLWMRRIATMAVAGVAAYVSYQHQRDFALAGDADLTTARLPTWAHIGRSVGGYFPSFAAGSNTRASLAGERTPSAR